MLMDLITRYRGVFVTLFVLPVSLLFKGYMGGRNRLVFWLSSAPGKHGQKVAGVQSQVRKWKRETGGSIPMCTARPGWQAMSLKQGCYKKTHYRVKIRLPDILEIDEQKRTVRVEPMVTMGQITAALNPRGWTLAVVPELDALTVGGLVNGFGIESSSHKYGLFQHICESFEIVTANGERVRCSRDDNAALFHAIPWSHGSLGFLVEAELRIVPAKRYVHLTYLPYHSKQEFLQRFADESSKPFGTVADFIEGLMFSQETGVLMLGNFSDRVPERQSRNAINHFWKPWFYEHVHAFLKQGRVAEEWIPLRHYYHRHTRSFFWEMQQIIPFGNHPLFRYLFGWMSPPEISLLKLTETRKIHELYDTFHMDQDFLIPMSTLDGFLSFVHREVNFYPLWLCPARIFQTPVRGFVNPSLEEDLFVDVGIYGEPSVVPYHAESTTRKLEKFVRGVNGYQALYADTYQTREEFRQMFDHTLLDRVRVDTGAVGAFPEPYDKVSRKARAA